MKAKRTVQLVLVALGLIILAVYLVLIHANNPQTILLPFIVPLPTTAVLVLALLCWDGFWAGCPPGYAPGVCSVKTGS